MTIALLRITPVYFIFGMCESFCFYWQIPTCINFMNEFLFYVRFWRYGKWIDIVIDDRLPTHGGKLLNMHSTEKNEFWSALLEKAYAKLYGSYEALKGGNASEAFEDFTGGISELYTLKEAPPNLYDILEKAYSRSSMMSCSIEPDQNIFEAVTPEGLVKGHAYSITKVKMIDINMPNKKGKIQLLRLRNPWVSVKIR